MRPLAVLTPHRLASWESPAGHHHLPGFSRVTLAAWTVPVGQHWLDGANIVYTGVCNTYANTDMYKHECNSNNRSKHSRLFVTVCMVSGVGAYSNSLYKMLLVQGRV